ACIPEPQSRFTVCPGTSTGKPASSSAMRATFRLSSPAWWAQPRITSSPSPGARPARPSAPWIAIAARSSGRTSFNCPPYRPIGVRAVATMTASFTELLLGAAGEEGLNAFDELLAAGLRLLEVRLELHRLLVRRVERVVHRALGGAERLPRLRGELRREVADLLLEPFCGHDPVDHA